MVSLKQMQKSLSKEHMFINILCFLAFLWLYMHPTILLSLDGIQLLLQTYVRKVSQKM